MRRSAYCLPLALIALLFVGCSDDDTKPTPDQGVDISGSDMSTSTDGQPDLSEQDQVLIDAIIPNNGPACPVDPAGSAGNCDGTIKVTLSGQNFERGAVVYVDGGSAYIITEVEVMPTTLSFQLPKQPYDTNQPHKASIQVAVGEKRSNRVYFQYTATADATEQSKGKLDTASLDAYRDWESEPIEGRVFVEGKTDTTTGAVAQLVAEIGIAPREATPISPLTHYNFAWFPAAFDRDEGDYDVFSGGVKPTVAGDHDIAFRFSVDGGFTWTYVDRDETNLAYEPAQAGSLGVTTAPVGYCREQSDCALNSFEVACKLGATWRDHRCVECLEDADCTGNPRALGPRCSTQQNLCYCAEAGDCANNGNGHLCLPSQAYCGCEQPTDCPDGDTCFQDFPEPGLFGCDTPQQ